MRDFIRDKERWLAEKQRHAERESAIVADVLLGASFVAYAGSFSLAQREELLTKSWLRDIRDRDLRP